MLVPELRISATDVAFKTAEGRAEMVARRHGLSPLERALLIVVDGRQDFAALLAALGRPSAGDAESRAALCRLLDLKLLTLVPADARSPAPVPSPVERKSLALARLYLMESVERALRGKTDALKPLLREATDEAGLRRALLACEKALLDAGAVSQASAIRARCLALLPGARSA